MHSGIIALGTVACDFDLNFLWHVASVSIMRRRGVLFVAVSQCISSSHERSRYTLIKYELEGSHLSGYSLYLSVCFGCLGYLR